MPALFIIYINDIDIGLNNLISKVADDTEIGNMIITDFDRLSLQEYLRKVSEWSQRLKMSFNCQQIPHFTSRHTEQKNIDYEMIGTKLESEQCVNDIDVKIAANLKPSQQCKDVAGKATETSRLKIKT